MSAPYGPGPEPTPSGAAPHQPDSPPYANAQQPPTGQNLPPGYGPPTPAQPAQGAPGVPPQPAPGGHGPQPTPGGHGPQPAPGGAPHPGGPPAAQGYPAPAGQGYPAPAAQPYPTRQQYRGSGSAPSRGTGLAVAAIVVALVGLVGHLIVQVVPYVVLLTNSDYSAIAGGMQVIGLIATIVDLGAVVLSLIALARSSRKAIAGIALGISASHLIGSSLALLMNLFSMI